MFWALVILLTLFNVGVLFVNYFYGVKDFFFYHISILYFKHYFALCSAYSRWIIQLLDSEFTPCYKYLIPKWHNYQYSQHRELHQLNEPARKCVRTFSKRKWSLTPWIIWSQREGASLPPGPTRGVYSQTHFNGSKKEKASRLWDAE